MTDRIIDDHQIAFIICTNDKIFLNETILYLNLLNVPDGFTTDIITIEGAESLCAGYNAGMRESHAMYKVYMHQDVLITDRDFLQKLLDIFASDDRIGMVGVAGAPKLDRHAIMWDMPRVGNLRSDKMNHMDFGFHENEIIDVDCIDGLLMATQVDLPWREDIFTGFHFYDVSQSFEFHKHGYRVVVRDVADDGIIHDCDIPGMFDYEKYRQICIKEYRDFLSPIDYRKSHGLESGENLWKKLYQNRANYIAAYREAENFLDSAIRNHDISLYAHFAKIIAAEINEYSFSERIIRLYRITQIVLSENNADFKQPDFLDDVNSVQEALSKYQIGRQMVIRKINHLPEPYVNEADMYLNKYLSTVAEHCITDIVDTRLGIE